MRCSCCQKTQELSWLVHPDLNLLKSWGGVPQSASDWNKKWNAHQQYKQKNRVKSMEGKGKIKQEAPWAGDSLK